MKSSSALLAFAMAALAGCSITGAPAPEVVAAPAAVRFGHVIPLLDVPSSVDRVRAVSGSDDSVHVFVASARAHVVYEIVVPPAGEVERRTVLADVDPSTLDAAFDRQGRLHALVDCEHLVFDAGTWRKSARTPWERLDVKPDGAHFVANAPDLVWVFRIGGRDLGASGRWEIYGMGGGRAGIIWPWFTRGTRSVVVADSPAGPGPWIVIDPEGSMDTEVIDATADDEGNVYLAYLATRGDMLADSSRYYVKLEPDVLAGKDGAEWRRPGVQASLQPLRAARGASLAAGVVVRGESAGRPNIVPYPPHYFGGAVAGGLRMSTRVAQRPRALVVASAHDKWLGRGFPVQYVEFDGVGWTAPLELGLADHAGGVFGGSIWDAFDLATTARGGAFAVWPTARGIVGRWIDAKP